MNRLAGLTLVVALFFVPSFAAAEPADPKLTQRVANNEPVASEPVVLAAGHVDFGPRIIDGKWQALIRDDTGKKPVWRQPEDVVFRIGEAAILTVPEDGKFNFLPQGKPVYVVPQQEIPGVPWLGWNTQSPEVAAALGVGAKIRIDGHEGPGMFSLFLQSGNFGAPQPLYLSTKTDNTEVFVQPNTHVHANWVFSEPGIHLVKITVTGQLKTGEQVADTKVLRFAVAADPDAARSQSWTGTAAAPANPWPGRLGLGLAILAGLAALGSGYFLIRRRQAGRG